MMSDAMCNAQRKSHSASRSVSTRCHLHQLTLQCRAQAANIELFIIIELVCTSKLPFTVAQRCADSVCQLFKSNAIVAMHVSKGRIARLQSEYCASRLHHRPVWRCLGYIPCARQHGPLFVSCALVLLSTLKRRFFLLTAELRMLLDQCHALRLTDRFSSQLLLSYRIESPEVKGSTSRLLVSLSSILAFPCIGRSVPGWRRMSRPLTLAALLWVASPKSHYCLPRHRVCLLAALLWTRSLPSSVAGKSVTIVHCRPA